MAIDAKYGRVTGENEPGNPLGDDEPVFIIRGRDYLATAALDTYATFAMVADRPEGFIDSVMDARQTFIEWQQDHVDLVKRPD